MHPLDPEVTRLLHRQCGVVARHQLLGAATAAHDVRRMLRRREWASLQPGVYVDHTGPPTWVQRAWGGVLVAWPAALAGRSALRAAAGPGWRGGSDTDPIEVAVDARRTVRPPAGVVVRRVAHLHDRVLWAAGPPRMRPEEATLDVAVDLLSRPGTADRGVLDAVEALAAPVRARCTTADRLLDALGRRERVGHRPLLEQVLTDLRDGTCSALEHGYLTHVEGPHGLPRPERQFHERIGGASVYRDAEYVAWQVSLELDGRTFHAAAEPHADDLDRDVHLATTGRIALRLGWRQVFDRSCHTAAAVGQLLRHRGWDGVPAPCGPGCLVADSRAA